MWFPCELPTAHRLENGFHFILTAEWHVQVVCKGFKVLGPFLNFLIRGYIHQDPQTVQGHIVVGFQSQFTQFGIDFDALSSDCGIVPNLHIVRAGNLVFETRTGHHIHPAPTLNAEILTLDIHISRIDQ